MLQTLLHNRRVGVLLVGAVLLHLVMGGLDIHLYRCPLRLATRLPCPGCGMSDAMLCLFRGDWANALLYHPFAPYFAFLGALTFAAACTRGARHDRFVRHVTQCERRTRIHAIFLTAFAAFGVGRLIASAFLPV
jgi:hypothetical protein